MTTLGAPLPFEDQCLEGIYDLVLRTCPKPARPELARLLLRVALYKEQQLRQQYMEAAQAKRRARRKTEERNTS